MFYTIRLFFFFYFTPFPKGTLMEQYLGANYIKFIKKLYFFVNLALICPLKQIKSLLKVFSIFNIQNQYILIMVQKEDKTAVANNNPMGMFGDMSMLREIIMGPKVIEYEQHFADIETLIQKNEEATRQRFEAFEKDMNARFDRLEQLLTQNVDKINTQMKNMSKNDKANMADLLVELSKKLKSE